MTRLGDFPASFMAADTKKTAIMGQDQLMVLSFFYGGIILTMLDFWIRTEHVVADVVELFGQG